MCSIFIFFLVYSDTVFLVVPSLASQAVLLLSSTDENEAESEGVSGGPSGGSTEAKGRDLTIFLLRVFLINI